MEREGEIARVPQFDGTNYPSWKFRMQVVLEEHELVECIQSELEEVEKYIVKQEDTNAVKEAKGRAAENRRKKDRRCKSLLIARIHDSQLEYIQDKLTPRAIWLALQRIFERRSIASRLHLKKKLLSLRHDGGSLQEHFLVFDRVVRDYKATGAMLEDIDIVCHLLLTLGSEYATVVTALETMPEENLSLDFVRCRLLDEEIKRKNVDVHMSAHKNDDAAFAGSNNGKQQKKKWKCFGCHKEGHTISNCPEKNKKTSAHYGINEDGVCFTSASKEFPPPQQVSWIIDSGSSEHLTNDRSLFECLFPMEKPMQIAVAKEGECITAKHRGEVKLTSIINGESIPITLKDVLYIPEARVNLLSVRKMEIAGLKIVFANGKVFAEKSSKLIAVGSRRGKLYEMNFRRESENEEKSSLYFCGRIPKSFELWHRRYGHLSAKNLSVLARNNMVSGLDFGNVNNTDVEAVCESCIAGKQTREPFSSREERRSKEVLDLVHSDVCGPVTPVGVNGERYFVSFIDDCSRFTVVFLMRSKDQVADKFREYEAIASTKFKKGITRFRCDNGGEYRARAFTDFCKQKGIVIEWTVPYTPEQNGTSERMNRTLIEKTRSMLEDSGADKRLWGQAIQTAAFLANRSPASAIDTKKTPFEIWNGYKPNVKRIRVFGVDAYVHIPKEYRKKLDVKSWRGTFVGYTVNGYRIWNPLRKEIVTARDVIFVEERNHDVEHVNENSRSEHKLWSSPGEIKEQFDVDDDQQIEQAEKNSDVEIGDEDRFDSAAEETDPEAVVENVTDEVRRPRRKRNAPGWHGDYELDYTGFALNATSFVDNLPGSLVEMKTRKDWPQWEQAIREEMDSLIKNDTWTLVKLPEGRKPISCKWVFKIKKSDNGQDDRYKARLVARGFSQRYGFDYSETYSPVAKLDTIRAVLAIANQDRWHVHQMDVRTAFLNGKITEEIYMIPPEGYKQSDGSVCRLNRALYGLKQSSRSWNLRFDQFMMQLGFRRSINDPCLYVKEAGGLRIVLILYVDDILVASGNIAMVEEVKQHFIDEFEMSDVGEVKSFLGMKVERNVEKRFLRISQRVFLENLLCRFNMQECKPIRTPMEYRLRLERGKQAELTDKPYRELVGCLMYVAFTSRPDLCAAANYFSQFQSCPTEQHWVHLKRVLRYIRGTLDLGLVYSGNDGAPVLEAYADADWANDLTDRKSLSGYVFRIYSNSVCWLTRKQSTISLSSTEAELIALSTAMCHGTWLLRLLGDLGIKMNNPVTYFEDNQSTIHVAEDERGVGRLKHVDVKHMFVRNEIQQRRVALQYVPTGEQLADVMTKGLPAEVFQKHRQNLGLVGSVN